MQHDLGVSIFGEPAKGSMAQDCIKKLCQPRPQDQDAQNKRHKSAQKVLEQLPDDFLDYCQVLKVTPSADLILFPSLVGHGMLQFWTTLLPNLPRAHDP